MPNYPFTDDILKTYDLLKNDQAFNKDCLTTTQTTRGLIASLADLVELLGYDELNPHLDQLREYASDNGAFASLESHLDYQFANLPTNLSLMSSYINDFAGLDRLPGYGTQAPSAPAVAGGGYVNLVSVSARAMMLGAPMAMMMADTGSGTGGAPGGGSKCASMGNAFGSIMGKANEFMGKAMGALGGISGAIGNIMGGNILGGIMQAGNLGGLAGVPGIGNIGSLVGGISGLAQGNIGQLGQIGSLIGNIGKFGNIGALGSFGSLIGGDLSKLVSIGGAISSLATMAGGAANYGSVPNVQALQSQLSAATADLQTANPTTLSATIKLVLPTLAVVAGHPNLGNATALGAQLEALMNFLDSAAVTPYTVSPIAQIGDITSMTADLKAITAILSASTVAVPGIENMALVVQNLNTLAALLASVNNTQATIQNIGTLNTALGNMGGLTGTGNIANTLGIAQSVIGGLTSLTNGGIMKSLTGVLGNLGGLTGSLGNLGGLTGALGGLTGGLGNITGMLGGLGGGLSGIMGSLGKLGGLGSMLGNIGGMMGGLGNIAGGIGSMIGGEKGLLGGAGNALAIIAGSFNLKALTNSACGADVLSNVGTDALKSALGGGAATTPTAGGGDSAGGSTPIAGTGLSSLPANPVPSLPTFAGSLGDPTQSGTNANAVPTLPSAPSGSTFGNPGTFQPQPTPIANAPAPPSRPTRLND